MGMQYTPADVARQVGRDPKNVRRHMRQVHGMRAGRGGRYDLDQSTFDLLVRELGGREPRAGRKSQTIRARIEPNLKDRAETVLRSVGLTPTEAVTLFYTQVVFHGGLPFDVRLPNAATRKAMEQARSGKGLTEYPSVEALFAKGR